MLETIIYVSQGLCIKACSYFVVCDIFTTVHDSQKSKNAEIPKSKQNRKSS